MSCTSTTACLAGGANSQNSAGVVLSSTDGGATWSPVSLPSGTEPVTALQCTAGTGCLVGAGARVLQTTDLGASWTTTVAVGMGLSSEFTCPTATECFEVGSGDSSEGQVDETTDGGATNWRSVASSAKYLFTVSCSTATRCLTGGYNPGTLATSDGTSWVLQPFPSGVSGLAAISCATVSDCVAVGDDAAGGAGAVTTDGGSSWNAVTLPVGYRALNVVCPSASICIASLTGESGDALVRSTDGGCSYGSQGAPPAGLSARRAP